MAATTDIPRKIEAGEAGFSQLEASLATATIKPRPNSVEMKDVNRHAVAADLNVNELDFNYDLDSSHYPLGNLRSLQQVFDAVQCHQHLGKSQNFSKQTSIECLEVNAHGGEWKVLNEAALRELVQTPPFKTLDPNHPGERTGLDQTGAHSTRDRPHEYGQYLSTDDIGGRFQNRGRLLLFLIPLTPAPQTSFGNRIGMTQSSATHFLEDLRINPSFLLNMIGRPDYWAPQSHWESDSTGRLVACDFSCQHPRWNLQVQGAPLSIYMRHNILEKQTTYIISHKLNDTSVNSLRTILNIALKGIRTDPNAHIFLDDPFDIHVILATLSFEASKFHVKRFQRFMWTQINEVDDHLGGMKPSSRDKLGELTKQLQVISQNADSHVANADVSIIAAVGIRDAHARLYAEFDVTSSHQSVRDSISYIIKSMEKQKLWFLNYKNRKDSTMSLVYNLVTQQDAANNIELAADMKRDSTSMNAIAALTMVFLPGTFTATIFGAGIFSAGAKSNSIHVSAMWWLWVVLTVPLTVLVMICWWFYKRVKDNWGDQPVVDNVNLISKLKRISSNPASSKKRVD